MPNVRYDEMHPTRFVDDTPKSAYARTNFGKKQPNGGLDRSRLVRMQAEDATSLASMSKQETDANLSRAMGQQARRRAAEALSTAREARARALRKS